MFPLSLLVVNASGSSSLLFSVGVGVFRIWSWKSIFLFFCVVVVALFWVHRWPPLSSSVRRGGDRGSFSHTALGVVTRGCQWGPSSLPTTRPRSFGSCFIFFFFFWFLTARERTPRRTSPRRQSAPRRGRGRCSGTAQMQSTTRRSP